jgi:hypothetical protein
MITVTTRPNGKIDVRLDGRKIAALAPDLSLLAGRVLTADELTDVRLALDEATIADDPEAELIAIFGPRR